jgi:hypothetical protein
MVDLLRLAWCLVTGLFRSRAALQAEILVLRHQVNVLRRKSPKRFVFSNIDRLVFADLYGLMPNVRNALKILQPATVIAWHRAGFRAYWRWKSPPRGGRPQASPEVRELMIGSIRRDCLDHMVVFGERHLRHLLHLYQRYYNEIRTHLSLHKDAPVPRQVRAAGQVLSVPILGGLHHQYVRV